MAETRKRAVDDTAEESAVKRLRDEDADIVGLLCADEDEMLSEFLKLLDWVDDEEYWPVLLDYSDSVDDKEDYWAPPTPPKVRFIGNPYSPPLIFQTMASYVTINGNEESCGSSFSDSESSVMASVDMGGFGIGTSSTPYQVLGFSLDGLDLDFDLQKWAEEAVEEEERGFGCGACGVSEEEGALGGGDGVDLDLGWDDDALARFLGEDLS